MIRGLADAHGRLLAEELARREALDPRDRGRRALAAVLALAAGAAVLAWSLRLPAGDAAFIPSTLLLAGVWIAGALAAGRPLRGAAPRTTRRAARELALGLAAGVALLAVFLLGAASVARVPALSDPVHALLAHAHWGALGPVLAVAALNGAAEEIFFRGALHDALPPRWAPTATTIAYGLVTAAAGIPLLALAAVILGALCSALRRASGALLAPIACHLSWSAGMILFLEPALDLWS